MYTQLSDEQQFIQQTAQRFATDELLPFAHLLDKEQLDQGQSNPEQGRAKLLENLSKLADLGFMGLDISSEYGGTEAFSVALTELGRGCASTAVPVSVTNMVAEVIKAYGTESQRQNCLPKLCSGEFAVGGLCLTESTAGSDPSGMRCRAVKQGENWLLNGSKLYITSAEYAGLFVVWALTDPEAPKGKGISCFLVPADTPGLSIGKAEQKMGQRGSSTNEVLFEDCCISADAILGTENQGFIIAVSELAGGRIGVGSFALGIGLAAMDFAREYIV
jgi:alkylation response protein AidB-like acyl-CoA dehydrogenase